MTDSSSKILHLQFGDLHARNSTCVVIFHKPGEECFSKLRKYLQKTTTDIKSIANYDMLLNQDVALSTSSALLVPYEPHHVPEYHAWMQRPELQELTASEPLSVEEEYAMQASWRNDTDKLTFIVCLPFASRPDAVHAGADDSPDQMIGDINLFLSDHPDSVCQSGGNEAMEGTEDQQANNGGGGAPPLRVVGEVEIMIAKPGATGQGRGRAALLAFLRYVGDHQADLCRAFAAGKGLREIARAPERLEYLRVKIGQGNAKSIGLFQSLGFAGDGQSNVFGEIELRLQGELGEVLRLWDQKWPGSVSNVEEIPYERDLTVEIEEGEEEDVDTEMDG